MSRILYRMLLLPGVVIASALAACSALAPPSAELHYQSRAVTRTAGELRVSAAVLSAQESVAVYGVPLAQKGIQPVWIEVQNNEPRTYFLLSPGLDPSFYPASEAAEAFSSGSTGGTRTEINQRFRRLAFRNPILPGMTTSGFVLKNLSEGATLVQLDLVARGLASTFSILVVVPGFHADYHASAIFWRTIYRPEEITNYMDDDAFRAALETLPCCATSQDGSKLGDPLNLVIVGDLDDAFPALVRRGWRPTEQKWSGALLKLVGSALAGDRYLNAPVSDLYLFGRAQDLALQKARDNVHQRNHLRLWLSPMRYQDKPVWVGQISRDIGSRLTIHSPTFTTHKIDPDVDEARTALAEDMAYSQNLMKIGLVKGVGAAPKDAPRRNLTTDPYYTDGHRGVLVFDRSPTAMSSIEFFGWEESHRRNDVTPGEEP
jgi:hypothetical protein